MEALRNSAFCSFHYSCLFFFRKSVSGLDASRVGVTMFSRVFNGPELGFGGLRQLQHEDLLLGGVWFAVRAALAASPGSWLGQAHHCGNE